MFLQLRFISIKPLYVLERYIIDLKLSLTGWPLRYVVASIEFVSFISKHYFTPLVHNSSELSFCFTPCTSCIYHLLLENGLSQPNSNSFLTHIAIFWNETLRDCTVVLFELRFLRHY